MLLYITLFTSLYVLSEVSGISVKIDGLVDLGPKWNFEYTFIPYDSNTNIGRQGSDVEPGRETDATTTPTTHADTERVATKKKHRNKLRKGKETEKPPVTSEKPLEKPKDEKSEKHSRHSGKHSGRSKKHSDKSEKHSEKSEKHEGKSEKHREKSGRSPGEKASATNSTQKLKGTTPDFIYKHVDNKSLILRSPHKVQEDSRLRDFTVHIYKQALRIFEELKKKVNDTKSIKQIDKLIHSYRDKFAEFVNDTQHVMVKTRLGTQKVILNTMESSNMILKKLIDHLMADNAHKAILRNQIKGVAGLLEAEIEKEMDVEYKHVCSKFGICRSGYVFSNFLSDVIGELIRADDKKLQLASDALTEAAKERNFKEVLQDKVEKRFRENIANFEKMDSDQIRAVLQIFRGILVNKYKPLPIMEGMNSKVVNRSLIILDLIDLLDENIKPNEENKLAWNDIKASFTDWADGNRDDVSDIMDAFTHHILSSGLEKFDSKTKKTFNDKLKLYYNIKR